MWIADTSEGERLIRSEGQSPRNASLARGVGNNKASIPDVRGTNRFSRKYERPAGVTCTLQTSKRFIERHSAEPSSILSNNPTWPGLLHQS
jgi:hypothetical protein